MPRKAIEITLTKEQREQLERMVCSHSAKRRISERAEIILACSAAKQNRAVITKGNWRTNYQGTLL